MYKVIFTEGSDKPIVSVDTSDNFESTELRYIVTMNEIRSVDLRDTESME